MYYTINITIIDCIKINYKKYFYKSFYILDLFNLLFSIL